MLKNSSLLIREILTSFWVVVPAFFLTTADNISILDWVSSKLGTTETELLVALVPPVTVSETVNVPTGTVITQVFAPKSEDAAGKAVTTAVASLVPPVTVSPMVNPEEEETIKDNVPSGYSATPVARVNVSCVIVHLFNPLFAQSANIKFNDRLAVFKSFPVRTIKPQRS